MRSTSENHPPSVTEAELAAPKAELSQLWNAPGGKRDWVAVNAASRRLHEAMVAPTLDWPAEQVAQNRERCDLAAADEMIEACESGGVIESDGITITFDDTDEIAAVARQSIRQVWHRRARRIISVRARRRVLAPRVRRPARSARSARRRADCRRTRPSRAGPSDEPGPGEPAGHPREVERQLGGSR